MEDVPALLGHRSIETTLGYVATGNSSVAPGQQQPASVGSWQPGGEMIVGVGRLLETGLEMPVPDVFCVPARHQDPVSSESQLLSLDDVAVHRHEFGPSTGLHGADGPGGFCLAGCTEHDDGGFGMHAGGFGLDDDGLGPIVLFGGLCDEVWHVPILPPGAADPRNEDYAEALDQEKH